MTNPIHPTNQQDHNTSTQHPVFVLLEHLIYPNIISGLWMKTPEEMATIKTAFTQKTPIVAVFQPLDEQPEWGITLHVLELKKHEGHLFVVVKGEERVRLSQLQDKVAIPLANTVTPPADKPSLLLLERLRDAFAHYVSLNENIAPVLVDTVMTCDPPLLCYYLAAVIQLAPADYVRLLSLLDGDEQLEFMLGHLLAAINKLDAQNDVNGQVQSDLARNQRETYLREQLRVIQGELGEGDPFQREINLLHTQVLMADMPDTVREKALEEVTRLGLMPPVSPEAGIIRTYIQWLLDVPWEKASKDNLNLKHAEKILKQGHYGLDKIRDRILEHIAVRKLAGSKMKSPILCFVGPPGVGKTSLGKSIAKALGREFVRVSLGGIRDEAEIRGHRRTYIGALPGRVIQTLKQAGTTNPVFMLDEIDKIGDDYRGDPASALLEVLDPEQNNAFSDHYLEVPYDLSKVMFIATANDLDPLPEALEDRLEVIEFRAYTEEEKVEIARQFLIPKQLTAHGLGKRGIVFQHDAMVSLIRHYTLEAGVRNLERELAGVCRKLARLVATNKAYPKRITPQLIEKYLGAPYVLESRINREDSVGMVTGLVWSSGGGDTQVIEVSLLAGKGSMTLTGQLGDVLQESAQAALSYVRSRAYELKIPFDDFEDYDVHVHMPEGAVPKDGPSAGVAIAIGILSVFTEQKVRSNFALTGEVTLRGNILPVGGIKEKVLAARRRGIKNVILPADNQKDLVDIPKVAQKDLNIHFVRHMQEVIDLMLLEAPAERQRDIEAAENDEKDEKDEG